MNAQKRQTATGNRSARSVRPCRPTFARPPWAIVSAAGAALAAAVLLSGCGDSGKSVTRLSPRGVPFLDGVAVPAGFRLVDKRTEDYESGGQRTARHEYTGNADPHAVRSFYREQMPLIGWNRVSDQNVKGTITIRFEKQNESCTVQIQSGGAFNRALIQIIVLPFERTPTEPPKRPLP